MIKVEIKGSDLKEEKIIIQMLNEFFLKLEGKGLEFKQKMVWI